MKVAVPTFTISLDFELAWGVPDRRDFGQYIPNLLGARAAVPRMLELFERRRIRATWATVGLLFCHDHDDLVAHLPTHLPPYLNQPINNYQFVELTRDPRTTDLYFAPTLVDQIRHTPGQELATHTFSHMYCLEPGPTIRHFEADLAAARKLADRLGVTLSSIVFPRNQYSDLHIDACARMGLTSYRGNPDTWMHAPSARETPQRRIGRALDTYLPIAPSIVRPNRHESGIINVPGTTFLRPWSPRLAAAEPLRLRRLRHQMSAAAEHNALFHLWWHPHNFGADLEANLRFLEQLIDHYDRLADRWGMQSLSMNDVSQLAPRENA